MSLSMLAQRLAGTLAALALLFSTAPAAPATARPALARPLGFPCFVQARWGGYTFWINVCLPALEYPGTPGCEACGPITIYVDGGELKSTVINRVTDVIDTANLVTGAETRFKDPAGVVQLIAVDSLNGNILTQTPTQLLLFGPTGRLIGAHPVATPIASLTFNKALRTFAALSTAIGTLTFYNERLAFIGALSLRGLALGARSRIVADAAGNYFIHSDGSQLVWQWRAAGPRPERWLPIRLATQSTPLGLASDGRALYFAQSGKLASYNASGAPVAATFTGLAAPNANFQIAF